MPVHVRGALILVVCLLASSFVLDLIIARFDAIG